MRGLTMRAIWAVAAGLIIFSACDGPPLTFGPSYVDLGVSLPGVERTQEVSLTNQRGTSVVLSGWRSSHPAFSLSFPPRLTLLPGETQWLSVRYVAGEVLGQVEESTLELSTEDGAQATIRATGIPSPIDCAVPELIDFGTVPFRATATRELRLRNGTEREAVAQLGALPDPFSTSPTGPITVPAGGEVLIKIHFTPTLNHGARELNANLRVRRHPLCADRVVRLLGNGVPQLLTWADTLQFGSTLVGETDQRFFVISNFTLNPVALSGFEVTSNPAFRLARVPLEVPAGERRDGMMTPGTATIELTFSPVFAGLVFAQLTMDTNEPTLPVLTTRMSGTGVEREVPLSWMPASLDFGSVPVGTTRRVSVTFSNLNFRPIALGAFEARSGTLASAFSVTASTLTVPAATGDAGHPVAGTASLEVSFTPSATGPSAGQLSAETELLSQPNILVNLRGAGAP